MKSKGLFTFILVALLAVALVLPVAAVAGGDQVNRPDGSGIFDDGQQAGGDTPVWAPRAEQSATP